MTDALSYFNGSNRRGFGARVPAPRRSSIDWKPSAELGFQRRSELTEDDARDGAAEWCAASGLRQYRSKALRNGECNRVEMNPNRFIEKKEHEEGHSKSFQFLIFCLNDRLVLQEF